MPRREANRASIEAAISALENRLRLMTRRHNDEINEVKQDLRELKNRHASQR